MTRQGTGFVPLTSAKRRLKRDQHVMTGCMTSDCVENFEGPRGLPDPVESNHYIFDQVIALSSVDGSQRG